MRPFKAILFIISFNFFQVDYLFAKIDSRLSLFIDELLEKTIPSCDQRRDFPCIQAHFEEAFQRLKKEKAWLEYADLLTWYNYYTLGYNELGKAYTGLIELEKTLDQHKLDFGDEYGSYWIDFQLRIGGYLYELGDWSTALAHYQRAEKYYTDLNTKTDEDLDNIGIMYLNFGGIYQHLGEYKLANQYYLKSLQHEQASKFKEENKSDISLIYKRLGDLYFAQNKYDQSIEAYQKARNHYLETDTSKVRNRNGLVVSTLGLAAVYRMLNIQEKRLSYLEAAAKYDRWPNGMDYDVSMELGLGYQAQHKLSQAKWYFSQSLNRRLVVFGKRSAKTAEAYAALGSLAANQQNYKAALREYESALTCLSGIRDRRPNLSSSRTFGSKEELRVLSLKSMALFQLYKKDHRPMDLQHAWRTIQQAVAVIDLLRNNPKLEADRFNLSTEAYPVYELALELAQAQGSSFAAKAFEIAEKSKAVVLLETIKSSNASKFGGVPSSMILAEKQIANEISLVEDSLFLSASPSHKRFEARLFELHLAYRNLLAKMSTDFPRYHQLRYDVAVIPASSIQNKLIHNQEAFIEYFVGERNIHVFVITQSGVTAKMIPLDFPLQEWVNRFQESLTKYHLQPNANYALYQATADDFVRIGYLLYQKLIANLDLPLPKKLTIIPDGLLCYIPFETLLTHQVRQSTAFLSHPYLLRNHIFSYAYSATTLSELKKIETPNTNFLGFAPNFRASAEKGSRGGALIPDTLFFNEKEVREISKVFGRASAFFREKATKSNFIQNASNFGIIHIATHAFVNSRNDPQIFFSNTFANGQIEKFSIRDLYNIHLKAKMVVLSACATGTGKLERGEGLISLARGFAFAGAKSIVCTLWPVNDRSTSTIMLGYYQILKKGKQKDISLHDAKLSYLAAQKEDFTAHPFFWGAYVPIGNMEPVFATSNYFYWIGAIFFLFVLFYQYRKKQK